MGLSAVFGGSGKFGVYPGSVPFPPVPPLHEGVKSHDDVSDFVGNGIGFGSDGFEFGVAKTSVGIEFGMERLGCIDKKCATGNLGGQRGIGKGEFDFGGRGWGVCGVEGFDGEGI